MEIVFALMVWFNSSPANPTMMGHYANLKNCQAQAANYTHAECKPVDATMPIYGTCWGCMHGCTWEANVKNCGVDPRPIDKP